jgi:hypothetical protein
MLGGEQIDEAALQDIIRAAVAPNLDSQAKSEPRPRRLSSKRVD